MADFGNSCHSSVMQESSAVVSADDSSDDDEDDEKFSHPFGSVLFLGTDNAGDMLPTRRLRQKYSVQRRDVAPTTSGAFSLQSETVAKNVD